MAAETERSAPVNLAVVAAISLMNVILIIAVLRGTLVGLPAELGIVLLLCVLASSLAVGWVLWRHEPASGTASTE